MDLTAFWAGPFAKSHAGLRSAPTSSRSKVVKRPDGMRFAGGRPPTNEHWWESGSIFLAVNANKRGLTLELGTPAGTARPRLIAECDVVIENFSPRVMANLGLELGRGGGGQSRVRCMVRMPAFGLDGPWRDRVGFAQTMEQVSGMAWLTGEADGPPVIPARRLRSDRRAARGLRALVALEHRGSTGRGALVEVTMVEAALNVAAQMVIEQSAYGQTLTARRQPGPSRHRRASIPCRAMSLGSDRGRDPTPAVAGTVRGDGTTALAAERDLATVEGRRGWADRIDTFIAAWTSERSPQQAVDLLQGAGVASAVVAASRDLLDNPQLRARRFFEKLEHRIVGSCEMPSQPMQLADPAHTWLRRPAPTLGQHNAEILTGMLGQDPAELETLSESKVIGTRPAGL